jgi:hypothetical protein
MSGENLNDDILCEYTVKAHGGRINGYSVDFTARVLRIDTEKDSARTVLRFEGLLAHQFEHAISDSVLYDVTALPLDEFIAEEKKRLVKALKYGFPAPVGGSLIGLRSKLREKNYKVFGVRACVGLCGYVIAKSVHADTTIE